MVGRYFDSATTQYAAIAAAVVLGVTLHWGNDGLWFQGDAPRHAATGLFYWDLLTDAPTHPVEYAASYYARYPVIVPGVYPPLFHLLEGPAFRIAGASPYVAKALVWFFAIIAAIYTMWWGRMLIASWAGWAGAFVLLLPGFVRYSNAVLPNIPATALGIAALYHLQRSLDEGEPLHWRLFLGFAVATVGTYMPGGVVLLVAMAWVIVRPKRWRGWSLWLPVAFMAALALVMAGSLPGHMARQAPSLARLFDITSWAYYARRLPGILGVAWPPLAAAGLVIAMLRSQCRPQGLRLLVAVSAILAGLACVPAKDPRYALPLGPLCILAACLGVAAVADVAGRWRQAVITGALTVMIVLATLFAVQTRVPQVSGILEVANYLETHGPTDAVLYSGVYDGVFSFYVRVLDRAFDRRVTLSNKLLYRYELGRDFRWAETPIAKSDAEVVTFIRSQCGCPWVAVEALPEQRLTASDRLLRHALAGPEFERVTSFEVVATAIKSIDLYRLREPVATVRSVNLSFPSFSERMFRDVVPVERGR